MQGLKHNAFESVRLARKATILTRPIATATCSLTILCVVIALKPNAKFWRCQHVQGSTLHWGLCHSSLRCQKRWLTSYCSVQQQNIAYLNVQDERWQNRDGDSTAERVHQRPENVNQSYKSWSESWFRSAETNKEKEFYMRREGVQSAHA